MEIISWNFRHSTSSISKQEPWRRPSRQAEFNGTDRLGLDARSDYQAVASNKSYFELKLN